MTAIIGTMLLWFGFRVPPILSTSTAASSGHPKFILAVVGNGLRGTSFSEKDCNVQESACAMARGAYAAYKSDMFSAYRQMIDYQQYDDSAGSGAKESSSDRAVDVALALQDDPRILAVIGHSFSETTAAAAQTYKVSQIPLLVPIATSPIVGYDPAPILHLPLRSAPPLDVGPHLGNVFRLVPNDRIAQAPTISYLVDRLSRAKNLTIGVLADLTDNPQYTTTLKSALQKQERMHSVAAGVIDSTCDRSLSVDCMKWDDGDQSRRPSLLVFVGTTRTSNRFLRDIILPHKADWFPTLEYLVLTDGCKNVDSDLLRRVAATGVKILITFPAKQLSPQDMETTQLKPLRAALGTRTTLSYEEYGFEAVLLLKLALDRLASAAQPLTRNTLVTALSQIDIVRDLPTPYIFENGENIHPDYGVYGIGIKLDVKQGAGTCALDSGGVADGDASKVSYLCSIGFDDVNLTR